MKSLRVSLLLVLLNAGAARANIVLLLEEPFGTFGGLNPTGHAAVYLSGVCADSLNSLRRCRGEEQGVVISRYHRIGGYDWIAIPVVPYLYAVDRTEQVPREVGEREVEALRDEYRRKHLTEVAPDDEDGSAPPGDWTQLIGAAYDRTIYTFALNTTADQDDRFIRALNSRANEQRFNLLFHNCADFARQVVDFYYPKAVRRSFTTDAGIMTPKQAAKCLVRYGKKHPGLQFASFTIPQVPGAVPRSSAVRGVIESLLKSKKYFLPLAPLAVLHPYVGGSLAVAWVKDGRFDPRDVAGPDNSAVEPEEIARQLQSKRIAGLTLGAGESEGASR
jgi:hypothetical protein